MSGWISVSPAGRMPSFGLVWARAAAAFGCAFADGDEQPMAAPMPAARTRRSGCFIIFMGTYQSNLRPTRARSGGTMVDGVRNVAPELQLMFAAAFVLNRL